mmetsp:Transcript_31057/g.70615  ORF Transcript_31057/g.70615 Transcript_31057/m.70615 type:complete len:354 (-) Transcript_31057:14-1075(-)
MVLARHAALLLLFARTELLECLHHLEAMQPSGVASTLTPAEDLQLREEGPNKMRGCDFSTVFTVMQDEDGTIGGMQVVSSPQPPAQRKPVMWMHLHKSAGTLMCKWALKAGERVVTPNEYCGADALGDARVPFWKDTVYQTICPMKKPNPSLTCDQRKAVFGKATFGAIERELYPGDICPSDFTYGTIMRDPIDRMESQINYEGPYAFRKIIKCIIENLQAKNNTVCDGAVSGDFVNVHTIFDNFAVRTLAGASAWFLPPGRIGPYHYKKALALIEKFALVIPLDQLSTEEGQARMDQVLGWHIEANVKLEDMRASRHTIKLDADVRSQLAELNKHDIALWEHVKRMWNQTRH